MHRLKRKKRRKNNKKAGVTSINVCVCVCCVACACMRVCVYVRARACVCVCMCVYVGVHKIDTSRTPKIISPQKSRPGKWSLSFTNHERFLSPTLFRSHQNTRLIHSRVPISLCAFSLYCRYFFFCFTPHRNSSSIDTTSIFSALSSDRDWSRWPCCATTDSAITYRWYTLVVLLSVILFLLCRRFSICNDR